MCVSSVCVCACRGGGARRRARCATLSLAASAHTRSHACTRALTHTRRTRPTSMTTSPRPRAPGPPFCSRSLAWWVGRGRRVHAHVKRGCVERVLGVAAWVGTWSEGVELGVGAWSRVWRWACRGARSWASHPPGPPPAQPPPPRPRRPAPHARVQGSYGDVDLYCNPLETNTAIPGPGQAYFS